MSDSTIRIAFAICLKDQGYKNLQSWKVYRTLTDADAAKANRLRVVDDSGSDNLYPADCFVVLDLPDKVRKQLIAAKR